MDCRFLQLKDCLSMITNGFVVKQSRDSNKAGGYPFTRIETLSNGKFNRDRMGYADIYNLDGLESYILDDEDILISHINSRRFLGRSVLYKKEGDEIILHGMNVLRVKTNRTVLNPVYANYLFQTSYYKNCIDNIRKDAINQSSFSIGDFQNLVIPVPDIDYQNKIATVLSSLDSKISLNQAINRNLEALAKQLYDYWFVQFDFPDKDGKPYKSSGGRMVCNEDIKMSMPYNWEVCRLNDFIGKNNTGDWGNDEPSGNSIEIGCIRGADIITLNDLPKRYIKSNKTEKLLSKWDMVIEVSGGSPVQATGRSAFITPGVIERNGGSISCSNFCHAFSFKDYRYSAYFFYVWNMFYDNGIMFKYEGKTSGIKNFMTETFLANKWIKAPEYLVVKFFNVIKDIYAKIDANIAENNDLTKQRDELLPLLMNGQVSVNSDLSNILILYKVTINPKIMKENIIQAVLAAMQRDLDCRQTARLKAVLLQELQGIEMKECDFDEKKRTKENLDLLTAFISAKKIEGCSEKTLCYYRNTIEKLLHAVEVTVNHITTSDIRQYLSHYQEQHHSSKVTIDNMRRIFSSFFSWLEDEDYIAKSPVRRIHKVKTDSLVKEVLSDEQLEQLRDNCNNKRNLAIIDVLASTGIRVGELVKLNRDDIDFHERQCIVFGKGNKERLVYFNARTKLHLQQYLNERTDNNPALFVSLFSPYNRLTISGVEVCMRKLGQQLDIPKVHPHKFRRTLATMAIDKGMPIEQVQRLLGHVRIDTTLHYAIVNQNNVKLAHKKYLG